MEDASPRDRAAVVVESLAAMDSSEIAETVINISGYQVLQHISGYQVLQHISGYQVLQHIFSLIFERHIFDILSIHKPPLAGVM